MPQQPMPQKHPPPPTTDEQAMQQLARLRSSIHAHLVASRAQHEACDEAIALLVRYVQQPSAPSAPSAAQQDEPQDS